MAGIRSRKRTDGTTGYTVNWRLGGTRDGAQQSETFDTRPAANQFRLDVEAAGHRWPDGWVKGVGYLRVEPDDEAAPETHLLAEFGHEFVTSRTGIGAHTHSDYAGQIERLAAG